MNAEISLKIEVTAEVDPEGVTLTVFAGEDHEGDVYTVPWTSLVDDMLEMSTYNEDGTMVESDREYIIKTAATLKEAAELLLTKLG